MDTQFRVTENYHLTFPAETAGNFGCPSEDDIYFIWRSANDN